MRAALEAKRDAILIALTLDLSHGVNLQLGDLLNEMIQIAEEHQTIETVEQHPVIEIQVASLNVLRTVVAEEIAKARTTTPPRKLKRPVRRTL